MASNVSGPSRRRLTALPSDADAMAVRHRPRVNSALERRVITGLGTRDSGLGVLIAGYRWPRGVSYGAKYSMPPIVNPAMAEPSPLANLDLDEATMRALGRRVADSVAEHLGSLRSKRAYTAITRAEADRLIAGPAPRAGADFETILATLRERVFANAALEPHPGFIAYVPSSPTFPAVLGDWLTTGYNFFGGAWQIAAGPSEVEAVVIEWLRGWIGMPAGAGGLLTNGGSGANLTAVVAARHEAVGDDATRIARLTLYTSDQ